MAQQFYPHGELKGWSAHGPGSAFLAPEIEWFSTEEIARDGTFVCCSHGVFMAGVCDGCGEPAEAGWYARLSASGYLDCTDWQGPYSTAFRAIRDLCRTYDIDLNGHDRFDPGEGR